MDIVHLRSFIAVVEEKSFTAAAARLGVAKSVCSRRISELETDLSAQLVHRTTRAVVPTQAGMDYYQDCLEVIGSFEDANHKAKSGASVVSGHLKLSLPVDYCGAVLAPKLESFAQIFPDVSLTIEMSDSTVDLVSGGYDAAVRIGTLIDSTLYARKIGQIRIVCCASPSYISKYGAPETVDDLSEHQCILYSNSSTGSDWVFYKDGQKIRKRVRGRYSVNNGLYQMTLAMNGHGIAYLPNFLADTQVDSGKLVRILEDYDQISIDIQVVYPEKKNMRAVLRAFIDHLAD